MEYSYRILDSVYDDMLSGKKTIEFRLLNDKSNSINIGDTIRVKVVDNEDKFLITEVVDKYIYNDINDLWNSGDAKNNNLDCSKDEFIELFNNIFGEDKVNDSKIVGFRIKLTNN